MNKDLASSVRARLLNLAKAEQSDFNGVLVRYALERLLYRLSQSAHADSFFLKGAMLFTLWYEMPHRPTRDVDLLGFGPSDLASVTETFKDIASVVVEDGISFDPASVTADEIRKEAGYAGARVIISTELAGARVKTHVDIGFGDAVMPGPVHAVYPVLLGDFPAPMLQTYPVYPRKSSWMRLSVPRSACPARRDNDAGSCPLGGATQLGALGVVQSGA